MIEEYAFGRIVIDGATYTSDVLIYPDRVDASWWRAEGHSVCLDDLRDALAADPAVLVLGQGTPGRMAVPDSVRDALTGRGVEVIVQPTAEAVKTYNRLAPDTRVVAGLHLTC